MGEDGKIPNVFHQEYRELNEGEKKAIEDIKRIAGDLYNYFHSEEPSRELALAKTKLEEAVMWAVKGITK